LTRFFTKKSVPLNAEDAEDNGEDAEGLRD